MSVENRNYEVGNSAITITLVREGAENNSFPKRKLEYFDEKSSNGNPETSSIDDGQFDNPNKLLRVDRNLEEENKIFTKKTENSGE